jgi:hypothetical protein
MSWAAFFGGLALGLGFGLVLALVGALAVAGALWRFARGLERAGLDIHLKDPKVNQLGP